MLDVDSDCTSDENDNCVVIYNPQQFDGDDDGVGAECDADDADEGVASLSAEVLTNISADASALDSAPDFSGEYVMTSSTCAATDNTLSITQELADLTVTGDVTGSYAAGLAQMANGTIVFQAGFVDGSTRYGIQTSTDELEIIQISESGTCVSLYFR